jgi:hypothetical protein
MEIKNFTMGDFSNTFGGKPVEDMLADLQKDTTNTTPIITPTQTAPITVDSNKDLTPEQILENLKNPANQPAETEEQKRVREEAEAVAAQTNPPKKTTKVPEVKLDDTTKTIVADLIKDGKLFGFEDGKIETKADLIELLEANKKAGLEEKEEDVFQRVFQSQTPAMQFLMTHAARVQNPQELLPLLTSTSNIEKVESLDESKPADQERIVRLKMKLAGDPDDVIDSEIQDLKDRAKLEEKAKVYKPVISQYYQRETQKIVAQKQEEDRQMQQTFDNNRRAIISTLEAKELDGLELKRNQKGLVWEMLAEPREEYDGGVGIYKVIDDLFMKGDFKKLSKLALLAADEKEFDSVYSTKLRMQNADSVARKLQTTNRSAGPTQDDTDDDNKQRVIQRPVNKTGSFSFLPK